MGMGAISLTIKRADTDDQPQVGLHQLDGCLDTMQIG